MKANSDRHIGQKASWKRLMKSC